MKRILPITVVIPTLNRSKDLMITIQSYVASSYIPNQIIIVDQSDNIEDRENIKNYIQELKEIEILLIELTEKSLTKSRNIGCNYVKNRIVVMSDDDITVQDETLLNVYNLMENDEIAMIGGINSNTQIGDSVLGYLLGIKNYFKKDTGYVTKAILGQFPSGKFNEINTQWAMGFFTVFDNECRKKWEIIWDEKLWGYAYPEDLDFSYRFYQEAKKNNKKCVLSDKVTVEHRCSPAARVPKTLSTYMYVVNREYLSYKFGFGLSSRIQIYWVNLCMFFKRLVQNKKPMDIVKAQLYCWKHHKEIKTMPLDRQFGEKLKHEN